MNTQPRAGGLKPAQGLELMRLDLGSLPLKGVWKNCPLEGPELGRASWAVGSKSYLREPGMHYARLQD